MSFIGAKPSQTLATPTSQYFNGTGSQTVFTLNRAVNVSEDLEVFVNNVQQEPGVGKSYTAVGTTLTFDAAPASGTANVYVVYRGLAEVTTRLEHDPNAALAATTGTFSGALTVDVNGATVATFDRATSDGTIIDLRKDGTTLGSIGAWSSSLLMGTGDVGLAFVDGTPERIQPRKADDQTSADGSIDLGHTNNRFKDLYLSGGVYLGGTGSANHLDDYEEGTITDLRIYFDTNLSATSQTGASYVTATGAIYTKIGRLVTVQFYWSGTYSANQVLLKHMENLPFVVGSSNNGFYGGNTSIAYHRGFGGYYRYNTSTDFSNNINLIVTPGTTNAHFKSWAHSFISTGYPLMNAGSGQELSASLTYMTS